MKLFRDVLVAKGSSTLEATTGVEAIDMASEHTPDLVLMDIQLPDLDGVGGAPSIAGGRTDGDDPRPCADRTSEAQGDRERFLAEGFDGYVSKPVNVREFIRDRSAALRGTARMSGDGTDSWSWTTLLPNVRLLEAVLTPRGYDVVSATDGERALGAGRVGRALTGDARRRDARAEDGYAVCRCDPGGGRRDVAGDRG